MRRPGRIRWLLALAVLGGLLALVPLVGYWGTQQAPQYYIEKLEHEQLHLSEAREASHELNRKVGALAGDLRQPGEWQAIFTQEQINGWLAVELPEKHAGVLPNGFRNPRVFITEEKASVACFYDGVWPPAVYSLDVEPYIAEESKLAIRLAGFRAGAVPAPLGMVLDEVKKQALRRRIPIEWADADGDPVAIIPLPSVEDMDRKRLVLESVELREGAIVLTGRTEKLAPDEARARVRVNLEVAQRYLRADEVESVQR